MYPREQGLMMLKMWLDPLWVSGRLYNEQQYPTKTPHLRSSAPPILMAPSCSASQAAREQDLHPPTHLRGPQSSCPRFCQGDWCIQYPHRASYRSRWVKFVYLYRQSNISTSAGQSKEWHNTVSTDIHELFSCTWVVCRPDLFPTKLVYLFFAVLVLCR